MVTCQIVIEIKFCYKHNLIFVGGLVNYNYGFTIVTESNKLFNCGVESEMEQEMWINGRSYLFPEFFFCGIHIFNNRSDKFIDINEK